MRSTTEWLPSDHWDHRVALGEVFQNTTNYVGLKPGVDL
jgi:hypothetical protein